MCPDFAIASRSRSDTLKSVSGMGQQESVICNGITIKLVAEVVSSHWQDDYARKNELQIIWLNPHCFELFK